MNLVFEHISSHVTLRIRIKVYQGHKVINKKNTVTFLNSMTFKPIMLRINESLRKIRFKKRILKKYIIHKISPVYSHNIKSLIKLKLV